MSVFTAATTSGSGTTTPVAGAVPPPAVAGADTSRALIPSTATDSANQTTGPLPRTGTNPTALLGGALSALIGGLGLRRLRPRPSGR